MRGDSAKLRAADEAALIVPKLKLDEIGEDAENSGDETVKTPRNGGQTFNQWENEQNENAWAGIMNDDEKDFLKKSNDYRKKL